MTGPDLSEPQVSDLRSWDRGRLPVIPRWVGVLALVVVLLGASAWVIGQQFSSSSHTSKRPLSPTANYVKFRFTVPGGAFQVAYPPSWKPLKTISSQYVLLAEGPNDGASYEVAKTTLTAPVSAANLGDALKLTERVVKSGDDVKLLRKPIALTLGGLPGYLYLYVFKDPATGEEGAHAHYFLFDGKTMITLVFQSLPSNNFVSQAHLFDRIASTLKALPSGR
jgi:hypothetical protein